MAGFQELAVSEEYRNKYGWFRVEFSPLPSKFRLRVDLFITRHRNVEDLVRKFLDRYCEGKEGVLRKGLRKMVRVLTLRRKQRRETVLRQFCSAHLVRCTQVERFAKAVRFHRRNVLRRAFGKFLVPIRLAREKELSRKMHRRHLLAQQMDRRRLLRLAFSIWGRELTEKRRTLLLQRQPNSKTRRVRNAIGTGEEVSGARERVEGALELRRGDDRNRNENKAAKKRKRGGGGGGGGGGGKGRKTKRRFPRLVMQETERFDQRMELLIWSFRRLKEFASQRKRVRKLLTERGIQILSLSPASVVPLSVTDMDLSKRICTCIVELCFFLKLTFSKIEQFRRDIQVPGVSQRMSIGLELGSVLGSCVYALSFFCRRKMNEMSPRDARNCLTSHLWIPVFRNVIDVLRNFVKQGNRFEKRYNTLTQQPTFCLNPMMRFVLFFHRQAREIALRTLGLFLRSLQDFFLEGYFDRSNVSHIDKSKRSQILILHLAMESSFDFFVNQMPMDCQCYIARFHGTLPSEYFGKRFGEPERSLFLSLLPSISLYGHVSPPLDT